MVFVSCDCRFFLSCASNFSRFSFLFSENLEGTASAPKSAAFWKVLGDGSKVKSAEAGGDDAEFEKQKEEGTFLYSFDAETGAKNRVAQGKEVVKGLLKNSESFVLDSLSEIYVWFGRNTSEVARTSAAAFGKELSKTPGRSADVMVSHEEALKENTVFREKFPDWVEGGATLTVKAQKNIEAKDWEHKVYDRGACKHTLLPLLFFSSELKMSMRCCC